MLMETYDTSREVCEAVLALSLVENNVNIAAEYFMKLAAEAQVSGRRVYWLLLCLPNISYYS